MKKFLKALGSSSSKNTQRMLELQKAVRAIRLQAKDIMSTDLVTCTQDKSIKDIDIIMSLSKIRHVLIVDAKQALIGLVSRGDILKYSSIDDFDPETGEYDFSKSKLTAKDLMSTKMMVAIPETPLEDVAGMMFESKKRSLPIVDKNKLVGIITEADFLKIFFKSATK